MPWVIRNLVSGVLLPPACFMLVQLAALCLWRIKPKLARRLLAGALAGLYLAAAPAVSSGAIHWVESRAKPLDLEDPALATRADAIVVLGAGRAFAAPEYGGRDVVSAPGVLRLRYAAVLQRKTRKPVLVTGGSPDREGPSEAKLMTQELRQAQGIEALWVEERAKNTGENAAFSSQLLMSAGIRRIFLVTHAWHMPRAERAFELAGLEVVPAPIDFHEGPGGGSAVDWLPSFKGLEMSYLAAHELVGAAWYRGSQAGRAN